jgi:hypothetical protein
VGEWESGRGGRGGLFPLPLILRKEESYAKYP